MPILSLNLFSAERKHSAFQFVYYGVRAMVLLFFLVVFGQGYAQEPKETLHSIYFGGGSWYIDQEQAVDLNELISSIPNLEYYEISITSHTDNIGSKEMNDYLSRMRSESVIQLMKKLGVNPEAIKYKDFGEENPVFDNNTYQGQLRNRRVDILFTPIQF